MFANNLRGEQGGEYVDDTAVHTPTVGAWAAAMVVTDTVVAAITQPKFDNEAAIVGKTLYAGSFIYGPITSIQLTSGIIQLFNYTDRNKNP